MAERIVEWQFKKGTLVTVQPIRRENLKEDWIGDESSGFPKGHVPTTDKRDTLTLENSRTY